MKSLGVLIAVLLMTACGGGSQRVVVAAGTTLVDSGVIDRVVADYEAIEGVRLSVVGESTASVLSLGRRGGAEVLVTHAPRLEAAFAAEGFSSFQAPVMTSRFVVAGPASRVVQLAGLGPAQAFGVIAAEGWTFVSRGDGSGTHEAELAIWDESGIDPTDAAWYEVTGQGMGLTLQVADQRSAFTLAEAGTLFSAQLGGLAVAELDSELLNPYTVTVTVGASDEAEDFARWLTGPEGSAAIAAADLALFGGGVFQPAG